MSTVEGQSRGGIDTKSRQIISKVEITATVGEKDSYLFDLTMAPRQTGESS